MPMDATYRNALRNHGATLITHIGLVNGSGVEVTGGTYARKPVTWTTTDTDGLMRPNANLVFDIPAGGVVAGWRGFSALTAGTNYGGEALTSETFGAAGTYTLRADLTAIDHNAA